MKIMIVDDHRAMRGMLQTIVSATFTSEVHFIECDNGEEAPGHYERHRPDCVLMDFQLGRTDGIQASAAILGLDASARIILITSHDGTSLRQRASRIPLYGFVAKDNLFELHPLLKTITSTNLV